MPVETNEISEKARGGTELMCDRLRQLPADLLDKFQIIPSRVRELDPTRVRILWCHDIAWDPASKHLANGGWKKFHKIVFVSHWQKNEYQNVYGIPASHCLVILNAIENVIDLSDDPRNFSKPDPIKVIYHTTPHRGLRILYKAFDEICSEHGYKIHLDVYSSFRIYGWDQRDEEFKELFEKIKSHPNMTYHGFQPNTIVREALLKSHIFAYPSIWPETSCIALIEAMASGLLCVHPDLAALPETAANLTYMYSWHENEQEHAQIFKKRLIDAIVDAPTVPDILTCANVYNNHRWDAVKDRWIYLLNELKDLPTTISEAGPTFEYRT